MQDDLDAAHRYIERAEECRAIATEMSDLRCKRSLMRVYESYVVMADQFVTMHIQAETMRRAGAGQ